MANYILGVDQSSNYKLYKADATLPTENFIKIGTLNGLKDDLIGAEATEPIDPSTKGITVTPGDTNAYTVTVGTDALDTSQATVSATPESSNTITLALAEGVDKAETTYTAAAGSSKITITPNYKSGWYVENNSLKYTNGNVAGSTTVTVTGALKSGLADSDYSFSGKTVTLKNSAFADDIANDATVTISNAEFTLLLSAEGTDAVPVAGTLADTAFSWKVTEVDSDSDGTAETATAQLRKVVADGWDATTGKTTYTYQKKDPYVYATITGLNKDTTAANLPTLAKNANVTNSSTAYELELVKANFPTKDKSVVTLTNGTPFTNDSNTTVTPNFQLAKGTDISADPSTKDNGEITLKIGEKASADAKVVNATVNQHLNEGWTLDNSQASKTITYYTAKDVTLATIKNLAAGVTASSAVFDKTNKTITLESGALLADASNTITLTPTELTTLTTNYDASYTADYTTYKLALGNVDKTENQSTGEYNAVNTNGTAILTAGIAQYWKLTTDTTVTYTAPTQSDALAKVDGLKSDATVSVTDATADVYFNTSSSHLVVLKEGAFKKEKDGLTSGSSKVTLESTNYKISLNGVAASKAKRSDPEVTISGTTASIKTTPSAGWDLDNDAKVVTYNAPAAVTLAEITGLKSSTQKTDVTIGTDGKTITLKSAALDSGKVTLAEKTDGNEYVNDYDFVLALDTDVTKYGSGEKTPTLNVVAVELADSESDSTLAGTKTAKIQVDESAGWKLADDNLSVTYTNKTTVDWIKVTGLGTGAVYDSAKNDGSNTVTFDSANKTIKVKQAALAEHDAQLTKATGVTDTAADGYKIAFDGDVDAPGTYYSGATLGAVSAEGAATITATLNKGWTQTDDDTISYTAAQENKEIATISGLSANATGVALGTTSDDPATTEADEHDTNIIYVPLAALADKDVTLTNKTIATKNTDKGIDKSITGDFKFMLGSSSDKSTTLGFEKNYAWTLNTAKTTAYYKQANEKGWTVSTDGATITHKAKVDPATATDGVTTLMTVTGLKGSLEVGTITVDLKKLPAIGTKSGNDFTPGLWISSDYVAAKAAEEASQGVEAQAAVPETAGKVTLKRNVLNATTSAKVTLDVKDNDFGKYEFALYDNAKDSDATADTYVPSKGMDKYVWAVDTNGAATYKKATTEYWALDDTKKSATYNAQKDTETLARITGLKTDLKAMEGDDFTTAKSATGDSWAVTGSYVYSGETAQASSNKVVEVTSEYVADDASTTNTDETVLGTITLKAGALNEKDVAFTAGDKKYRLALDSSVTGFTADEPTWSLSGTTATYTQKVTAAGYNVTDKDKDTDNVGQTITYTETGNRTLATITNLKSGITLGTDGKVGSKAGITEANGVFTLNGNVLGTSTVSLTNGTGQSYKLAVGTGALDYKNETEKAIIDGKQDVWRITTNSKGVPTAYYRNVTPAYYTPAEDGLSIAYKPEATAKTYTTIAGLKDGITISETDPDATTFSSKLGADAGSTFKEGITVGKDADGNDILTVSNNVLESTRTVSLTDGSTKYTFVLDTASNNKVDTVGVTDTPTWTVDGNTATLTGKLTEGWVVDASNTGKSKRITHFNAVDSKVIATLSGVKSGVETSKLPTLPSAADGSFEITTDVLDGKDVTLNNGKSSDGTDFTYGIKLADSLETEAATAVDGVDRWYLDGTTLNYSTIHDAHYEDLATKTSKSTSTEATKTTIKYVAETIDETPIISVTGLKEGLTLLGNVVDNKYYKSTDANATAGGTPVTGITVDSSAKTVTLAEGVLNKDSAKPTTITNKTTVFSEKYKLKGEGLATPGSGSDVKTFKVDGTKAELWKGKSAGFEVSNDKISYVSATQDTVVTTINGIASGLVVNEDGNEIGTAENGKFKTAAITFDNEHKFTLTQDALTTTNVTIDGTGTLALADAVTTAWNANKEAYSWKVNGTTATYSKGNKEGWEIPTVGVDTGSIVYHKEEYATDLATVTNLASGLKVDSTNKEKLLDKTGKKTAVTITRDKIVDGTTVNEITLANSALNKKNVTVTRVKKTGSETDEYNTATTFTVALDKSTKTEDGKTVNDDNTYVENSSIKPDWAKDSKDASKVTYTITTKAGYDVATAAADTPTIPEGADAFVEYTADAVAKATLTGLKDGIDYKTLITITAPTAEEIKKGADPNTAGTMTLKSGALNGKDVKLTNSKTDYTLALESPTSASTPMWHVSNGTATYKETYAKGGYVKKSDTEITYLAEDRVDTLATVTGLDKTLDATADAGVNDATAKTKYGISASTITRAKASTETTASGQLADAEPTTTTETVNVINLSDRTKLAAGNVTVKDGTKTYELYMTDSDGIADKAAVFAQVEYKDTPQWGYSKGTATLDGGKSAGWVYKSDDDHKTLTYKKAQPNIVATVKGLNATNLELVDGAIKSFTTTTSGTTETKTYSTGPVITYTKSTEDGEPGTITLTDGALVTGNGLKDKVKVTLTSDDYVLNAGTISAPSVQANEWSVDTKGVASYQYNTTAGWTLDDTGKNFTYSASKDTVLAKISGLVKGDDTTTYTKTTADGKTTYTPATVAVASLDYIDVTEDSTADGTHKKYIFTLKDASKLSTSNISLTKSDKTSGNEYELQAASSIAPVSYDTKWTVIGSGGKATLTSGSDAGYENATGTKAGMVVNYVKETASKTLATITGLKKDTSTTADTDKLEKVFSTVVTVNSSDKTINLTNAEKILVTGDKATTVSLSSKEGYKFGTVSGTPIKTNITPELAYKSGTLTVVETAKAGDYTLSTDAMKLVYNKKDTTTVLATVKGLSKNLALKDGKLVTATSVKKGETPTYGTTAVATLDTNTGQITLEKDALAETKIGFSLGKGVEDGSYSLELGAGVMTESGDWREQTGWVNKNGTATYKTYDMGYYYDDGKGGFAYASASKGKTLVTITGLQKDADVSGFATGTSGTIKLDSTTLNGKKVTLKNNAAGYNFKLALDTTGTNKVTESGLTGHTWKSGNLTASQTVGYKKDSDTQISYIAKQKDNQKIASLSGIKKDSSIKYEGATINLTGAHLNNANVVLTTTGLDDVDYKINLTGTTEPTTTADSEPWTAKGTTETFTGSVTAGYTLSKSGKSVTYTKANGTAEKPKALVTVKGVSDSQMSTTASDKVSISGGSPTISSGLLPIEYSGSGTIVGSKDADTITLTNAATVNGGKGDDYIKLNSSATNTVIYSNGDGNDVIEGFGTDDKIVLNSGKVAGVKAGGTNNADAIVTIGKQTIQLTGGASLNAINIVDKNGKELWSEGLTSSSDVLLADDNYSMDAASLSDITEPFKASYTPYDFDAGLDLVKQNSFTPALTFTGTSDKK